MYASGFSLFSPSLSFRSSNQAGEIESQHRFFINGGHEEHERCLLYLNASTRKLLVATTKKQLLECHIYAIFDMVFTMLIDGNCIEDLQRMYTLFSRINTLESLRNEIVTGK